MELVAIQKAEDKKIVDMPKFDAASLIERIKDKLDDKTKMMILYEDGEGRLSVASCKYTPPEMLWIMKTFELSLLSGEMRE